MKRLLLISAVIGAVMLCSGCVSLEKLDRKMPLINAEEITVTAKSPFLGTARIHAKNLVNTEVEKTADEYIASLDTPWGTVSYEAKGYKRKKRTEDATAENAEIAEPQ